MKKTLTLVIAVIAWIAVVGQYIIILNKHTFPVVEATIRFFSFFTILTNTVVAIFFTGLMLPEKMQPKMFKSTGALTAVTVYITMVGSVYQIMLRHIWQPQGMQLLIDELLHTLGPFLVIVFWCLFEHKALLKYRQIFAWLIYPVVYLGYTLIHGHFSNFYPYYFIDVSELGLRKVLTTAAMLVLIFIVMCCVFVLLGRSVFKNRTQAYQ